MCRGTGHQPMNHTTSSGVPGGPETLTTTTTTTGTMPADAIRLVKANQIINALDRCADCFAPIEVWHDPEGLWLSCDCDAGYIDGRELVRVLDYREEEI